MGKSSKQKQASSSQTEMNPYAPAKPLIDDFLGQLSNAGTPGLTGTQADAFNTLKTSAAGGDPYATNKGAHTEFLYNQAGPDGRIAQNYDQTASALSPYTSGQYLDPFSNPQMQEMLQVVGDNAFDRINSAFAGAGRDITGNAAGQEAAARGISQAQLPILFDQFNKQQQLQQAALGQLTGTAQGATNAQAGLGGQGFAAGDAALDASNYGAERLIDLEQKIKGTPYEDLALTASLLFPASGLGGTSNTQSQGYGKASQGLSLFSDRRLKQNVRAIGETYDGQTIYAYEYINGRRTHIGLIAQEVQEDVPAAVTEWKGYLMVDYAIATQAAQGAAP